MNGMPTAEVRFRFPGCEAQGEVTVLPAPQGLQIEVKDGDTVWIFAVDLWHLSTDGLTDDPKTGRCVQIVAYHPQHPEDDPVQHLRVYPDGLVETFVR